MKIEEHKSLEQAAKQSDHSEKRITIILPYFNETLGTELKQNCKKALIENGVKEENINIVRVGGSLEIPFACKKIAQTKDNDAIIALGIVIKGETSHYDIVCEYCYKGLMEVQLNSDIPITFGILTCNNIEQAQNRTSAEKLNKGKEFALTTLIQTQIK